MDKRYGRVQWGPHGDRVRTSAANWRKPLAWNKAAASAGERPRVFCASLADWADTHHSIPDAWRKDLGDLIKATPNLDWLLLTKRIGNAAGLLCQMFPHGVPSNVWIGLTVVNQKEADRDVPELLELKESRGCAVSRVFLSMEPLLGPVDIRLWLSADYECAESCGERSRFPSAIERCQDCGEDSDSASTSDGCPKCGGPLDDVCPTCGSHMVYEHPDTPTLDFLIVGGESGHGARPMHPDWARSLRDQCAAAGVPFFFKQWGEWAPYDRSRIDGKNLATPNSLDSPMQQFGKKAAGRLLDGVEHNGMPEMRQ